MWKSIHNLLLTLLASQTLAQNGVTTAKSYTGWDW